MTQGILGMVVCGTVFFILVPVLIYALVKKKTTLTWICALVLPLMLAGAIRSAYILARGLKNRVEDITAPRTGDEIYTALFGKPEKCVRVLNQQDQTVPVIDFAIYLKAETCPQEIQRITALRKYEIQKIPAGGNTPIDHISWFLPNSLGDSLWSLTSLNEYGNGSEIYLSLDSTRMYCRDIAN